MNIGFVNSLAFSRNSDVYMSALTYIKMRAFVKKTVELTNPMFNYSIHFCSNPPSTLIFLEKAAESCLSTPGPIVDLFTTPD